MPLSFSLDRCHRSNPYSKVKGGVGILDTGAPSHAVHRSMSTIMAAIRALDQGERAGAILTSRFRIRALLRLT